MKQRMSETNTPPVKLRDFALLSRRAFLYMWLPLALLLSAGILITQRLVAPPPTAIRLLGGPEGSSFERQAEKYKKIIESHGVKVVVLPSRGALDNLQKLANPKAKVDVGFVQGGLTDGVDISQLFSLGSLFPQPLMVYYRGREPMEILSQLKGKRLAIGPEGSGARMLALKLLEANDMSKPPTVLLALEGEEAAKGVEEGDVARHGGGLCHAAGCCRWVHETGAGSPARVTRLRARVPASNPLFSTRSTVLLSYRSQAA